MRPKNIAALAGTACLAFAASVLGGCGLAGERSQPYGIATTSMAVCQILDRLEIDEVVGIPSAAEDIDLPERYEGVATIGNAMTPDMEILSNINPELVLVPRTLEAGLSAQFANAGITAQYIDLSSVEGMYDDIDALGRQFGREQQAAAMRAEYETYVEEHRVTAEQPQTVLVLMAYPGGFYLIVTADSYVGSLIELAGGTNVYGKDYVDDGSGVAAVNQEHMIQTDPDKICVFAHYDEESAFAYMRNEIATGELWQSFRAVREGEVYYLSSDDAFGMSANLDWYAAFDFLTETVFAQA